MGAGAIKASQSCTVNTQNLSGKPQQSASEMSCESCSAEFSLFKRKRTCSDCTRLFCSACVLKYSVGTMTKRRCTCCRMLASGNFSRKDLNEMKVRELRQFLVRHRISHDNCMEKSDLVDVILRYSNNIHYQQEEAAAIQRLTELQERQRNNTISPSNRVMEDMALDSMSSSEPSPATSHRQVPSDSNPTSSTPPQQPSPAQPLRPSPPPQSTHTQPQAMESESPAMPHRPDAPPTYSDVTELRLDTEGEAPPASQARPLRASLDHVKSVEDIEDLSVRQLKEILVTNFVDYKGCCEKWELLNLVRRLWQSRQDNTKRAEEIFSKEEIQVSQLPGATEGPCDPTGVGKDHDELCKICMDALTDCVLLECGHMVTCIQCGKQLAECPICRQYISRVVRIFKS